MIIQGDDCVRYEDWLIHTETENVNTSICRERVSNAVHCIGKMFSVSVNQSEYLYFDGRTFV